MNWNTHKIIMFRAPPPPREKKNIIAPPPSPSIPALHPPSPENSIIIIIRSSSSSSNCCCCCGCCCCCHECFSTFAWLPGWVPWCVAVGRVALAGSTILGAPVVRLQESCCCAVVVVVLVVIVLVVVVLLLRRRRHPPPPPRPPPRRPRPQRRIGLVVIGVVVVLVVAGVVLVVVVAAAVAAVAIGVFPLVPGLLVGFPGVCCCRSGRPGWLGNPRCPGGSHARVLLLRCRCPSCCFSTCAWLPGWVPWCVAVGRVALAGSAILGAPMVRLQRSCCCDVCFRCSPPSAAMTTPQRWMIWPTYCVIVVPAAVVGDGLPAVAVSAFGARRRLRP